MKVLTKFSTRIIPVLLLAAMAGVFVACPTTEPEPEPKPITWELEQVGGVDGAATTTGIKITFSEAVTNLLPSEVVVSGVAEIDGTKVFDDGGAVWTIPITLDRPGTAQVSITRTDRVVNDTKNILVYTENEEIPATYSVQVDGVENTTTTTKLTFTFTEDVTGLTADNIVIANAEGNALKGELSGSGTTWTLGVTVNAQGNITVMVQKDGIEYTTQIVRVYYAISSGIQDSFTRPPEKPTVVKLQGGFEFTDDVDLLNPGSAITDLSKHRPTIAFNWTGAGATVYNLYWSDEQVKPTTPQVSRISDQSYIINKYAENEDLEAEWDYYIWIEAVNSQGGTLSDPITVTTSKKGTQADGGVERGDYPRNMKVAPGNGSLTVWWDIPDRVGWHEIYYAEKGTINTVDAYTSLKFNWYALEGDPVENFNKVAYTEHGTEYVFEEPADPTGWYELDYSGTKFWATGYTKSLFPFLTPLAGNGGWEGYYVGRHDGIDGDTRPIIGIEDGNYAEEGAFPYIFEAWKEGDVADDNNNIGKLQPYTKLHSAFANAIPWDGTQAGTPGTPIRYYRNSVTITGLVNGKEYEVWVRVPNVNGERGYGYVVGTPGAGGLAAPGGVSVTAPAETTRDLSITWNKVDGADGYRLYFSSFDQTPNAMSAYTAVAATDANTYTVSKGGLLPNTTYYVWVAAEKGGIAGNMGTSKSGRTGKAPDSGTPNKTKMALGSSQPVKTLMYVEVNENNPLNAGSYILEDGSYLFDYVVLFAGNIRTRNCALEAEPHGCTLNGPHLHLNENVRHIVTNHSKYIKPLQDKGIKVLMGILPDHDGISLGTMNDSERADFVASVQDQIERYNLDGIDLDDEWASKEDWDNWPDQTTPSTSSVWVYPVSTWWWPFYVQVYRDPSKGVEAGNGTLTPNTPAEQDRMWEELGMGTYKTITALRTAMPDKIITVYEYNTGGWISANGTNSLDSSITAAALADQVDFFLNPMYNQYIDESPNAIPHKQYAPIAIDVSGAAYEAQQGTPNPPMDNTGSGTITDFATRFKDAASSNPYGYMCLYGLTRSSELLKYDLNSSPTVTKEEYLSIMTEIVFGQKTILTNEGGDYQKDW